MQSNEKPAATIVMYESRLCGYCRAARRLLEQKQWTYTSIMVDGQPELRAEMQERSGRHTVPQIFFGQTHVGGFDDLNELEHLGKLDDLYSSLDH